MAFNYVGELTSDELNSKNVVYCATFPNGKKYVGITRRKLKYRIREHKKDSDDGSDILFHKAIRKYGFENICWDILKHCNSIKDLVDSEVYNIKELKTFVDDEQGYNLTTGGGGSTEWSEVMKDRYRGSNNPSSKLTEDITSSPAVFIIRPGR